LLLSRISHDDRGAFTHGSGAGTTFIPPPSHYMNCMRNRIRGLKEWSDIPRTLAGSLINFEYNPNFARTEQVPTFLAERGKPVVTKLARFGINLPTKDGKKRPPLLNARTDSLRRGSFKTMLANRRCVIPAEGFYEWREEQATSSRTFSHARTASPSCSPAYGTTRRSKAMWFLRLPF
jgi:putative SOS response-associated peptidase YedK